MITSSQIKFVRSLRQKKFREEHGCFVAEGAKLVREFAQSRFTVRQVYILDEAIEQAIPLTDIPVEAVRLSEMERITGLSSPSPLLAVIEIPADDPPEHLPENELILALDGIRDPGNLGTIIRIADWFGIDQVICSHDCVDTYNPKVIQATMGSVIRVKTTCTDLPRLLASGRGEIPVYGMTLDGEDLYRSETTAHGLLVIGSEAQGISDEVLRLVTRRLSIPSFPPHRNTHAESLNAAIATGIVCAEFRRRQADKRTSGQADKGLMRNGK